MLDRMLANVLGLQRSDVYVANVFASTSRDQASTDSSGPICCRTFLREHLGVIQPKVVLVLGAAAVRLVFGPAAGLARFRGTWRDLDHSGGRARAMPTFHPAYLLRNPAEKRKVFEDLKAVKLLLNEKPE
jgi:DNA polymerase